MKVPFEDDATNAKQQIENNMFIIFMFIIKYFDDLSFHTLAMW